MSKNNELQQAINILLQGDKTNAERQLWSIESTISDKRQRIQLIDALISASNPIDGGEKLLKLSNEAIGIAKKIGNKKLVSHFMLRRVNLLMGTLIFPQHEQGNLKLSPNWLEFSTELDKVKFDECSSIIIQTENEMNDLLSQVVKIAKSEKDISIIANVYLMQGNIISSKLLRQKSKYICGSIGVKLWIKFHVFRYPFFNFLTVPKFRQRQQIKKMTKNFIKHILDAASIFEKLDDV